MNKRLVIDRRMYKESVEALKNLGFELLSTPCDGRFHEPVSAHPDMFIAKVFDKIFVDDVVHNVFINLEFLSFCNREYPSVPIEYPYDITFNCCTIGKFLLCNKKYTQKEILEYAKSSGMTIIATKQGYAKCSTCVVSDNAIITEDDNIELVCKQRGIDVLKIKKGFVGLSGYDYGFIGGCSGLIEKNILAFNGSLKLHPAGEKISDFCNKHMVKAISLCEKPLYDVGSIIRI